MGSSIKANLIDRALGVVGLQRTVNTVQNNNIQRFPNVVMSTMGISALWQKDGISSNVKTYTGSSMVYSIVNRVCKTAAVAPFKVYRIKAGKKDLHRKYLEYTGVNATAESLREAVRIKALVYEEDNTHPLNDLIENPNPWQNGTEFVINSVGFKLLTGNRFWDQLILEEGGDKGLVTQITPLPPQHMEIIPDGTPYGVKEYRFVLDRSGDTIPYERIIHSKYFNPEFEADGSHLWGLSPIKAACKNITRSDAALERGVAMLQNAGAAGMVVDRGGSNDGSPDGLEQAYATKAAINRTINGSGNSGRIGLLNGDFDYLNFGLNAKDMEVIGTEKYSDQKICNIFSVPPGLFDPDKMTYENSKEFKKELIIGAVIPELATLREDWNKIGKRYKDAVYVDYDLSVYPELQEDFGKQVVALQNVWYMTGNEKRLMIGQDEDNDNEMMKKYLVPSGFTLLDSLNELDINDLTDDPAA